MSRIPEADYKVTEAEVIASLARTASAPKVVDPNDYPAFVITNDDQNVESLERLLPSPSRIRQRVMIDDVTSFIDYLNTFKDEHSRVFVSLAEEQVVAVVDYHDRVKPRWGDHVAVLRLRKSIPWDAWTKIHNADLSQVRFAEFLEDNSGSIVKPKAAEVVEMARTFSAKTDVAFSSAVRLENGDVQLAFAEKTAASAGKRGNIEIPTQLELKVCPFEGSNEETVIVRMRYRINDGVLTFKLTIARREELERAVLDSIAAQVRKATNLPVHIGVVTPSK